MRFHPPVRELRFYGLPLGHSYQIPKRLEASLIGMSLRIGLALRHVTPIGMLRVNRPPYMGHTGSSKSNALRQLLRQVAERGESAIVYDHAMRIVLSKHCSNQN